MNTKEMTKNFPYKQVLEELFSVQEQELILIQEISKKGRISPADEESLYELLYERRKILALLRNLRPKPGEEKEILLHIKSLLERENLIKEHFIKLKEELKEKQQKIGQSQKAITCYYKASISP